MHSARACGAEPPAPAVQVNDVEMTNGVCHEAPPAAVGPRQMIDRTEYVRLLEQALHSLGFLAAAQALERESARALTLPHALARARHGLARARPRVLARARHALVHASPACTGLASRWLVWRCRCFLLRLLLTQAASSCVCSGARLPSSSPDDACRWGHDRCACPAACSLCLAHRGWHACMPCACSSARGPRNAPSSMLQACSVKGVRPMP